MCAEGTVTGHQTGQCFHFVEAEKDAGESSSNLIDPGFEQEELCVRRPGLPILSDVPENADDSGAGRERRFESLRDPVEELLRRRRRPDDRETLSVLETVDIETMFLKEGEDAPGLIIIADRDAVIEAAQAGFQKTHGPGKIALCFSQVGDVRVDGHAPAGDPQIDRQRLSPRLLARLFRHARTFQMPKAV